MPSQKTFIVGDVHGCQQEFFDLLDKISYHPSKHRLILLGDIINRGPFSWEMLQWVKSNKVESIKGNHEDIFIQYVRSNQKSNPGFDQLKEKMKDELNSYINWMSSWPLYIEENDFLAVHAGLAPSKHPKETNPEILMYIRNCQNSGRPWYELYTQDKLVVYGHWATQGLNIRKNTIGLDSGCVYGKQLSGLLLPDKKLIQVPARKTYFKERWPSG